MKLRTKSQPAYKRWLRKWWFIPVAVIVGIIVLIVLTAGRDSQSASKTDSNGAKDSLKLEASGENLQTESKTADKTDAGTTDSDPQAAAPKGSEADVAKNAKPAANASELTINQVTTMTPTYYGSPGTSTYKRINFTIHNKASYEQTLGSNYGANFMARGITSTKEIKEPLNLPGSNQWQFATIAAGGTADGFVLFMPDQDIVALEWKAPGNPASLYYPLPDQN